MKTDQFDEEFRRKLLSLPAEVDPGEVERIQSFVNANKPGFLGLDWGKLLLYGGIGLLLIGSITYNVFQNYRNTHLQSSLDSLVHRPADQPAFSEKIIRDTVYITQSSNAIKSIALPDSLAETSRQNTMAQSAKGKSTETQPMGSIAMEHPKLPQPVQGGISSRAELVPPRIESRSTEQVMVNPSPSHNQRSQGRERFNQVRTESDESVASLPPASRDHSATDKTENTTRSETLLKSIPTGTEEVGGHSPTSSLSPATRPNTHRSTVRRQTDLSKGQTPVGNTRNEGLAMNHSRRQKQRKIEGPPTTGFTPAIPENPGSSELMSTIDRQLIIAEPLISQQTRTTSNRLAIISPSQSLIVPKSEVSGKAPRRTWHLTMPNLTVPNAQYRIGAGLVGGSDQARGALLGEIMLNRHWSVQTGLQLGYNQGFHYRDEQDFNEHQKVDFRETYASQVPLSSTIQDIQQITLLVQIPFQIAYHYPFGRQWGLRLGLGTELNLWGRSAVSFDYRENSRSSEHELTRSKEHTHTIDNLLLSTALERSWRKWQFRAGPFISPQLRPVDYKRDDLSWGANLQIFYRLGK